MVTTDHRSPIPHCHTYCALCGRLSRLRTLSLSIALTLSTTNYKRAFTRLVIHQASSELPLTLHTSAPPSDHLSAALTVVSCRSIRPSQSKRLYVCPQSTHSIHPSQSIHSTNHATKVDSHAAKGPESTESTRKKKKSKGDKKAERLERKKSQRELKKKARGGSSPGGGEPLE